MNVSNRTEWYEMNNKNDQNKGTKFDPFSNKFKLISKICLIDYNKCGKLNWQLLLYKQLLFWLMIKVSFGLVCKNISKSCLEFRNLNLQRTLPLIFFPKYCPTFLGKYYIFLILLLRFRKFGFKYLTN